MKTNETRVQFTLTHTAAKALALAAARDERTQQAYLSRIVREHPAIREFISFLEQEVVEQAAPAPSTAN